MFDIWNIDEDVVYVVVDILFIWYIDFCDEVIVVVCGIEFGDDFFFIDFVGNFVGLVGFVVDLGENVVYIVFFLIDFFYVN